MRRVVPIRCVFLVALLVMSVRAFAESGPWIRCANFTPTSEHWDTLDHQVLTQKGTFGAANSTHAYEDKDSQRLTAWFYDSGGTVTSLVDTPRALWTGTRNVCIALNASNQPLLYIDGEQVQSSATVVNQTGTQSTCYAAGSNCNGLFTFSGTNSGQCSGAVVGDCNTTPTPRTGSAEKIYAVLDSTCTGLSLANSWPKKLETNINSVRRLTSSYCVAGSTSAGFVTRWTNYVKPQILAHPEERATLVVGNTTNDIINSISAVTSWSNLEAIVDDALALGVPVVLIANGPWKNSVNWSAGVEPTYRAVRTSILAYCDGASAATGPGHGRVNCVDLYRELADPATAGCGTASPPAGGCALLAAYDSGDHLHPSQAGHNKVASLLGPTFLLSRRYPAVREQLADARRRTVLAHAPWRPWFAPPFVAGLNRFTDVPAPSQQ